MPAIQKDSLERCVEFLALHFAQNFAETDYLNYWQLCMKYGSKKIMRNFLNILFMLPITLIYAQFSQYLH